jgi:hypothetical protein
MVALQNRQNKGVVCKIVQEKELRDVFCFAGLCQFKCGAKTARWNDYWTEDCLE